MVDSRYSRVLREVPLLLIMVLFCPSACGKVIYVDDDGQADFDNIQAGINAAAYGDTVSVAPGTYFENITLKSGVDLIGAGADATIIDAGGYGDVVDASANDAVISGFTLRNSGVFDLGHMNCGLHSRGSCVSTVRNNVITGNRIGIGLWDGAGLDVRNNVIENNSDGLYIYGSEEHPSNPTIVNNTIVSNQTNGVTLRVMVSPLIANNIIVEHATGINHNYVTGSPVMKYNNLWQNDANYMRDNGVDETLAGAGSLSVDPHFAEPGHRVDVDDPNAVWISGDYHLKSEAGRWDPVSETWVIDDVSSPCIDVGDVDAPIDLEPIPNGGVVNMGAPEY